MTTMLKIIMPQLIKYALPATMNLWLVILKDSSIVSLIGLNDMMHAAHVAAAESFSPFTYYAFAGLIYLLLSWLSLYIKKYVQHKLSQGDTHAITCA
jgi:ABC-type arginine transport system permease subunit